MTPGRSAFEIREVGADCSGLLAVRRSWFPDAEPDFDERFRDWWDRERSVRHAVVAYAGQTAVGMANGQVFTRMPAAARPQARWLYAANIYVAEEHRRQGIARSSSRR